MQFPLASALADVHFVAETPSTFELVDQFAADWTCWATLNQTAGRARIDRRWVTPPNQALAACVLVRPSAGHSWTPLATGLAVQRAVSSLIPGEPKVKWPNDVLVGGRKISGILCEMRGDAVVIGFGINLVQDADALLPTATSLREEGAEGDAESLSDQVLAGVLETLRRDVPRLGMSTLKSEIESVCSTIGQRVRAEMPNGENIIGTAIGLSDDGGLVLRTTGGEQTVTAADIVHLRPAES